MFGAPHHGSRTFFRYDKKDDPYLDALKGIDPQYVIISAPTSEESEWDHPHEDAVKLYVDQVGSEDNVLHTGEKRHSFICDIYRDGEVSVTSDNGDLAETYPYNDSDDDGEDGSSQKSITKLVYIHTRVDDRPMGKE